MGYERGGRMHLYRCQPGRDISDGLVCIEKDDDILAIFSVVSYYRRLILMVDHTNFLKTLKDDVIINGSPPLPLVISPRKMPRKKAAVPVVVADQGTSTRSQHVQETFEDFVRAKEDEDSAEW
jgi:hypothetical protein